MRAVAVISTGGSTFCTGSLINDTANDHKMYFITANHCGINAGNAASLVAFWNYQNSFCRTPGSAASGQAGDGSLTQFHTGSFFRAANAASDFTLVELDDPPVPAYNHFWEGWDRSTGDFTCTPGAPCARDPSPEHGREAHHLRRSPTRRPPATTTRPRPGDGTHIWVHWATDPPGPFTVPGVTEPGSSGSPLYNAAGRYIGQLHGGPSACGATGDNLSDYYGRFSVSWTGGGTNSTRLSNWLDAGSTGATTIDGVAACTAPGAPAIGTATATGAEHDPGHLGQRLALRRRPSTSTAPAAPAPRPAPSAVVGPGVAGSPFNDTTVSGGTTYAYPGHRPRRHRRLRVRPVGLRPGHGHRRLHAAADLRGARQRHQQRGRHLRPHPRPGRRPPPTAAARSPTTSTARPRPASRRAPGNRIATGVTGTGYTDTSVADQRHDLLLHRARGRRLERRRGQQHRAAERRAHRTDHHRHPDRDLRRRAAASTTRAGPTARSPAPTTGRSRRPSRRRPRTPGSPTARPTRLRPGPGLARRSCRRRAPRSPSGTPSPSRATTVVLRRRHARDLDQRRLDLDRPCPTPLSPPGGFNGTVEPASATRSAASGPGATAPSGR